jgi:hypothetical protein
MDTLDKINFMNDMKRQMQSIVSFQEKHAAIARVHMFRVKSNKNADFIMSLKQVIRCCPKPQPIKKCIPAVPRYFDHTIIKFLKQRNSIVSNSFIQKSFDNVQINNKHNEERDYSKRNKLRNLIILNTNSKAKNFNSLKQYRRFNTFKIKKHTNINQSAIIKSYADDFISLPEI